MAKNIMIQVWAGSLDEMTQMSTSLAARYCKKHGIEHRFILKSQVTMKNPTWEKLVVWDEEFSGYDNVMILDTDIMIRPESPNIFEAYEFKHVLGSPCSGEHEEGIEIHHDQLITGGNIIYTKEFLDKTRPHIEEQIARANPRACDEPIIRDTAKAGGCDYYTNTHLYWNWGVKRHGFVDDQAYFIHYHCKSKSRFSYKEWDKVLRNDEAWQSTQ